MEEQQEVGKKQERRSRRVERKRYSFVEKRKAIWYVRCREQASRFPQ